MIAGSLFSGIEGLGLGLLWSGLVTEIAWQVEIDPFCRIILQKHFPNADRSISDVRTANGSNLGRVDSIFGGFPCQDISTAGDGAGLAGARSGLWYEMLRIIREVQPTWALVENVASGRSRWLCEVRSDLQECGYRTSAYHIGVDDCGGPHRRKRIFVLAYAERVELRQQSRGSSGADREGATEPCGHGTQRMAHAQCISGQEGQLEVSPSIAGRQFESRMGRGADGIPARMDRWPARPGEEQYDWEPPRALTAVPNRAARLKALGNAVSPIVAYHVGLWVQRVLAEAGVVP